MCRFAEATRTTTRAIRLLLSRAGLTWQNRRVTSLGPDPQVFAVGKFHLDLAEFAVVIAVRRLVNDKILAAQLARDSRQPVLKFIHIHCKVCASSCLFGQAHEVSAFLAINHSLWRAEGSDGFSGDYVDEGFGTLGDVNNIF